MELKWRGEDAYSLLREKFRDLAVYLGQDGADIVRVEIFKAFSYFNTVSSQHMSEYVSHFRKGPELFERFKISYYLDRFTFIEKRKREQDGALQGVMQMGYLRASSV